MAEVVAVIMEVNALYRLRQAQGVVGLADKYGAERLDAACRRALAVGDPSYRTVKGILVAGTEHDGEDEHPTSRRRPRPTCTGPRRLFDMEVALMKTAHHLEEPLRKLKLFGMLDTLEARLAQASAGELGHVELLQACARTRPPGETPTGLERRLKAARFEQTTTIEDFDFAFNP